MRNLINWFRANVLFKNDELKHFTDLNEND